MSYLSFLIGVLSSHLVYYSLSIAELRLDFSFGLPILNLGSIECL